MDLGGVEYQMHTLNRTLRLYRGCGDAGFLEAGILAEVLEWNDSGYRDRAT